MKVLWSYEPFLEDKKRNKLMYKLIMQFTKNKKSDALVGYVATHNNTNLTLAYDIPEDKRFSDYPKSEIKKELKASQIDVSDITVVETKSYSNTNSVDLLLKLAGHKKAELIALFTNSKKGISRYILGSFAETAVHRSSTDLIVLNPKANLKSNLKKLLYASDFGPQSKSEFKKLFTYAKTLNCSVIVFHQAEIVYSWITNESSPEFKSYRKKTDMMVEWIKSLAQDSGVNIEVIITSDLNSTSEQILRLAKKQKVDLIAVNAKADSFSALIGGSVTRQVLRESTLPVLILKTK